MPQYLRALELHEKDQKWKMVGNLVGQGMATVGQLAFMYMMTRGRPGSTRPIVPMFFPMGCEGRSSLGEFMLVPDLHDALEWH